MLLNLISIFLLITTGSGFLRKQFINRTLYADENVNSGEPLFLTPYIEQGKYDEAIKLSRVVGLPTKVESYTGFLTVNKKFNSNMFFWYFPSKSADPRDPVILWLQGGPGGSSLFGLFNENGPFVVDKNIKLSEREYSWHNKYNLLFIDNPVGTGFSFTDEPGYSSDEQDIAKNLYEALSQFFELFSDLKSNDFYITGESYAGKYVPTLAHYIMNQDPPKKMNLVGIGIGDGFTDPPEMLLGYSEFLHQIGLFNSRQAKFFQQEAQYGKQLVDQKRYAEAMHVFDLLLNADLIDIPSFFYNCTGATDYYNYLNTDQPKEFEYYGTYINQGSIRELIHVGKLPYNDGKSVEKHLINDIMKSAINYLEPVMDKYKVLIYSGQLDIIVALPLTESMIDRMSWKDRAGFDNAKRKPWKVDKSDAEVAGYVRQHNGFYYVTIRSAGHIAPYDQPRRCYDMIDRFIQGKHFD